MPRTAEIVRKTKETEIRVKLTLEGKGESKIQTNIGFFDHMLQTLARHGQFDLEIDAKGDLQTGDHHTVEDVGICLGEAFKKAVGDKKGIVRFGAAYCPMDEALARAVVDLSGRPHFEYEMPIAFHGIGNFQGDSAVEFFGAFANAGGNTVHLDLLRGANLHHGIEAMFKALALALKKAVQIQADVHSIPSTKGAL